MNGYTLGCCLLLLVATGCAHAQDAVPLVEIGAPDGTPSELALADDGYQAFSTDAFFVAGQSSPEEDWPFCQPGPNDQWGGTTPHTFSLYFGLKDDPAAGPWQLDVHILDAHGINPPEVAIGLNGREILRQRAEQGGGDDSITRGDYSKVRPHLMSVSLPADALVRGTNHITITTVSGCWILYDAVRVFGPATAELAPVAPVTRIDSARGVQALVESPSGLAQVVRLHLSHIGEETQGRILCNGAEIRDILLSSGTHLWEIGVPRVQAPQDVAIRIETDSGGAAEATIRLRPVREWTLYLLHHTHLDIGYTHTQDEVEQLQMRYLREIGEHIEASATQPEEAHFTWLPEGLWPVESYLAAATDAERATLLDQVRAGSLGLDGLYGNALTALYSEEEILALLGYARRLRRDEGLPIDSAMLSDVPGATWGLVPALAHSGIRYISMGPNVGHRVGWTRLWDDKPFWWVSPSGEERVLCWMAGTGYSWFHGGWSFDDGHITDRHKQRFFEYLERLDTEAYPYDIVHLRYNIGGDNGPPDPGLSRAVAEWNERYAWPRIIVATTSEAFRAFEDRYGDVLPSVAGDLTPYWEDGAASTAADTAVVRRAVERLVQAEALPVIRGTQALAAEDVWDVWRETVLYDEHTWGAHNSISEPDSEFAIAQARHKQGFALEADRLSRELLDRVLPPVAGPVVAVEVYNTLTWPRTEVVELPAEWDLPGDRVIGPDGAPVPSQRLRSGALAFLASEVAPVGSAVYRVEAGEPAAGGSAAASGLLLSNDLLDVEVNPLTGAIQRLSHAGSEANLVDSEGGIGLNEYVYVPGRDRTVRQYVEESQITVGEAGPLVASLIIDSSAPGARSLRRELRLVAGSPELQIVNTIDKLPIREKEAVFFAFPMGMQNPETRHDTPWSVVEVESDQLRGGCRNYLTVQRWVDVCGDGGGATLVTVDAPLIQVGDIRTDVPFMWGAAPEWERSLAPSGTIFSYVMNNYWETNYKADQEGLAEFRYALTPYHGTFNALAAARRGMEETRPLLAAPAGAEQTGIASAVTVDAAGVLATSVRPAPEGEGLLVRLFAASGKPETVSLQLNGRAPARVTLTDPDGYGEERVELPLRMPAWGVRTVRLEAE
jgi:hypothetical protein